MSKPSSKDHFELWLFWLLRGGTSLALALILIGLVINAVTGQSWIAATDLPLLLSGSEDLRSPPPANLAEFVYGFRSLQSLNFIQCAILLLILLPAFRVAFLFGNFLRKRDYVFVLISGIVLSALILGYFLRIEI